MNRRLVKVSPQHLNTSETDAYTDTDVDRNDALSPSTSSHLSYLRHNETTSDEEPQSVTARSQLSQFSSDVSKTYSQVYSEIYEESRARQEKAAQICREFQAKTAERTAYWVETLGDIQKDECGSSQNSKRNEETESELDELVQDEFNVIAQYEIDQLADIQGCIEEYISDIKGILLERGRKTERNPRTSQHSGTGSNELTLRTIREVKQLNVESEMELTSRNERVNILRLEHCDVYLPGRTHTEIKSENSAELKKKVEIASRIFHGCSTDSTFNLELVKKIKRRKSRNFRNSRKNFFENTSAKFTNTHTKEDRELKQPSIKIQEVSNETHKSEDDPSYISSSSSGVLSEPSEEEELEQVYVNLSMQTAELTNRPTVRITPKSYQDRACSPINVPLLPQLPQEMLSKEMNVEDLNSDDFRLSEMPQTSKSHNSYQENQDIGIQYPSEQEFQQKLTPRADESSTCGSNENEILENSLSDNSSHCKLLNSSMSSLNQSTRSNLSISSYEPSERFYRRTQAEEDVDLPLLNYKLPPKLEDQIDKKIKQLYDAEMCFQTSQRQQQNDELLQQFNKMLQRELKLIAPKLQ